MVDVDFAEMITLILDEEMDIESRDSALYRVLTESLRPRLLRRFRSYEKVAPFAFEDALQEFFLYLRGDGNNDLLSSYYAETIAQFTQAEEINSLRYSYCTDSSDMLLHDGGCIYQYEEIIEFRKL